MTVLRGVCVRQPNGYVPALGCAWLRKVAGQPGSSARPRGFFGRARVADGDGRDDQVGDLDPDRTRAASSSTRRAAAGVARGRLDGTLERVCVSGGREIDPTV